MRNLRRGYEIRIGWLDYSYQPVYHLNRHVRPSARRDPLREGLCVGSDSL